MNKYFKDIDSISFLLTLIIFTVLFLIFLFNINPICDEAHAWNIAQNLSIPEIFNITRYEGHTALWYLFIAPIAKLNFGYPHSLKFLNFLVILTAVIIFWAKSPFNIVTKIFLIFSFPVFLMLDFARCYSLSLLLITLICSTYNKRTEHPIIYSILLITLANTSVMAMVGAFSFGILFLIDLYKEYKNNLKKLILPLSVLIFGCILIFLQLGNFEIPYYAKETDWNFNTHFLMFYNYKTPNIFAKLTFITHSFLVLTSFIFLRKSKQAVFFLTTSTIMLLIIFAKIYAGEAWHFNFLFIYFVATIWIFLSNNKFETKFQKIYYIIFICFCFFLFMYPKQLQKDDSIYKFIRYFKYHHLEYSNAKIYCPYNEIISIVPYFEGYNIKFYDKKGNNLRTLKFYQNNHKYGFDGDKFAQTVVDASKKSDRVYVLYEEEDRYFTDYLFEKFARENNMHIVFHKCIEPYIMLQLVSNFDN